MAKKTKSNGAKERISVSFGNALHDLGMVADLPKGVLWFYRYLDCDGERLDDREVMPLVMIISLKEGLDGQGLRLSDLPSTTPFDTLRRYLTKWKRMGLVFTRSIYYSYSEMREHFGGNPPSTPRLKHVVYDLSNLMHNISLVAQEYARRNLDALAEWEKANRKGDPPVYQFPEDYTHAICLAPEVAAQIVDEENGYTHKKYIAPRWRELAYRMLNETEAADETIAALREKRANRSGAHCVKSAQTVPEQPTHCAENAQTAGAHCAETAQTLIDDEEEGDEEKMISFLLARFVARKGGSAYKPGRQEEIKVQKLLYEGYSPQQIASAIDQAFDTRPANAKPVRGFGFVVSHAHHHLSPASPPGQPTPSTEDSTEVLTEGTPPTGEPTGMTTETKAVEDACGDPMARVRGLLRAATIQGMEGVEDTLYDLPGIRLGLYHLLEREAPFSPDEVYDAVLAAVSRNVQPERLVPYAETVLENARSEARERERLNQTIAETIHTGQGDVEQRQEAIERSVIAAQDVEHPSPDREALALWQSALSELELQMTKATFSTWLRPARLLAWESAQSDGSGNGSTRVVLGVPNGYVKDWLENRLLTPIQRTLCGIAGQPVEITFYAVNSTAVDGTQEQVL